MALDDENTNSIEEMYIGIAGMAKCEGSFRVFRRDLSTRRDRQTRQGTKTDNEKLQDPRDVQGLETF